MRILIADDEAPARARLRQLLAAHPDAEVVAEAENGAQAMLLAASTGADLLLLDIQMPGGSGLDVAASLPHPRPAIIFCTAYDQHAVDAFELNALDYLLKPVSRARLKQALERLGATKPADVQCRLDHAVRDREESVARFLVRKGTHYVVVPASKASYFESVDGLTRMTIESGESYWIDPPLQDLETRLDPQVFFRISRSAMVRIAEVVEVHPLPGGAAALVLRCGVQLEVSRRRYRELLGMIERV